jgi:Zn finger protein HypA/HybF involved in hydrogenase expression
MPSFKCRKCYPTNVPDDWTRTKKSEIAKIVREDKFTSSILAMRTKSNLELTDAKNISLHISREKGTCHHCKTNLVEYEGNCPKCKRLNLDW